MSKTTVNCALAVLLRDSENMLDIVGTINAADILMSTSIAKQLSERGVQLNCADTHTVKTPAHPVLLPDESELDADTDYDGCYLVCDGALIIRPGGGARATALEGAFVDGQLFYPASLPAKALTALRAERKIRYPDNALLIPRDFHLDARTADGLAPGVPVCVGRTLYALDAEAAVAAFARGVTFSGDRLVALQSLCDAPGLADFGRVTRVPDGYAFVSEAPKSLALLYERYGGKVYLTDDLTVQPSEIDALAQFASIVVRGEAQVTRGALETAKRVITADELQVFEGTFVRINGKLTMDHAELAAALQSGSPLTVKVNGLLDFADDVLPEDIAAIARLDYNGVVTASGAVRNALAAVIGRANGKLCDGKELPIGVGQNAAEEGQAINTALFALIE